MKDLVRLRTSLSEEIESILNEQIQREAKASAAYLAMATWCDNRGFTNSADFFYHQSGEEREHMMKIYKYVNDVGGRSVSPEITGIQYDFDSLRSVFEEALDQEVTNTQSINRVVDACYKLKDYPTIEFMQWFLKEQVEEVSSMSDLLAIVERAVENPLWAEEYLAREGVGEDGEDPTAPPAAGGAL